MVNNKRTFIQLPQDVTDNSQLRLFLSRLVEQLDIAFGNRGNSPFVAHSDLESNATTVAELTKDFNKLVIEFNKLDKSFLKLDSSNMAEPLKYKDDMLPILPNHLITLKVLDDRVGKVIELPDKLSSKATQNDIINKINELIDTIAQSKLFTGA